VLLLCASCKARPERFATEATYDAPRSGLRVVAFAKGAVPPGRDMATGVAVVAVVCPAATHAGRPIRLDVAPDTAEPRTVSVTDRAAKTSLPWVPGRRDVSLTQALDAAGYGTPDAEEVAELADALDSVALGPKGVRIAGQTRTLLVAKVDFTAHARPTLASCAP
jgi:hypothetical protein